MKPITRQQKQEIRIARLKEEILTGTFVENVFFGANEVYEKLDEGEICLDVAYSQMVGEVEANGHMLLRPEAVSELALIVEGFLSALEYMGPARGGAAEEDAHLQFIETTKKFSKWCDLAKARYKQAHPYHRQLLKG